MAVYFIGSECGRVKIGKADYPSGRLTDLQTANPGKLELLAEVPQGDLSTEAMIHRWFALSWVRGEWFHRSDALEWLIAHVAAGNELCEPPKELERAAHGAERYAPPPPRAPLKPLPVTDAKPPEPRDLDFRDLFEAWQSVVNANPEAGDERDLFLQSSEPRPFWTQLGLWYPRKDWKEYHASFHNCDGWQVTAREIRANLSDPEALAAIWIQALLRPIRDVDYLGGEVGQANTLAQRRHLVRWHYKSTNVLPFDFSGVSRRGEPRMSYESVVRQAAMLRVATVAAWRFVLFTEQVRGMERLQEQLCQHS